MTDSENLTIQEQLDQELDKQLLAAVKADDPPAAILNTARQRLKDLGYTKIATGKSPADEMADELGLNSDPNILPMPIIEDYDDETDAATGT